jgi:hypothetical protein
MANLFKTFCTDMYDMQCNVKGIYSFKSLESKISFKSN